MAATDATIERNPPNFAKSIAGMHDGLRGSLDGDGKCVFKLLSSTANLLLTRKLLMICNTEQQLKYTFAIAV